MLIGGRSTRYLRLMPVLQLAAVAVWALPAAVFGHGGRAHDVPEAAAADPATAPALLLAFDKSTQRRFHLRTQLVEAAASAIELPAQVIVDPRRQILLTADQAGTLEAPSGGFAEIGSSVRAGQVLALLRPVMQEPERRDLQSDLAFAERDVSLGEIQIKRYGINLAEKFDVKLPTPSIQVVLDYRTAQARAKAFQAALSEPIPLKAPADGVLLHSLVRRGAAVAPGQSLFELSLDNPRVVEMQFADRGLDDAAAVQAKTLSGHMLPLTFLGDAYDPALRLRRALYALPASEIVAIGEPLTLQVPSARIPGHWLLPVGAVIKDEGESWIWVHQQAEQFVAHAVTATPAGPGWMQVAGDFDGDDRIVIEGAAILQSQACHRALHS